MTVLKVSGVKIKKIISGCNLLNLNLKWSNVRKQFNLPMSTSRTMKIARNTDISFTFHTRG